MGIKRPLEMAWGQGEAVWHGVRKGTNFCAWDWGVVSLSTSETRGLPHGPHNEGSVVKPLVLISSHNVGCSKNNCTNTYMQNSRCHCLVKSDKSHILHAWWSPTSSYRQDRLTRQIRLPQTHHSELPSPKCHREIGYGNKPHPWLTNINLYNNWKFSVID